MWMHCASELEGLSCDAVVVAPRKLHPAQDSIVGTRYHPHSAHSHHPPAYEDRSMSERFYMSSAISPAMEFSSTCPAYNIWLQCQPLDLIVYDSLVDPLIRQWIWKQLSLSVMKYYIIYRIASIVLLDAQYLERQKENIVSNLNSKNNADDYTIMHIKDTLSSFEFIEMRRFFPSSDNNGLKFFRTSEWNLL